MTADVDAVLDACVTRLEALGLAVGGVVVPVSKAKQPHQEQGQTPLTQFTVCPKQPSPRPSVKLDNVHDLDSFCVQLVLWTPGDRSRTTNLGDLAAIEKAVFEAFDDRPPDDLGLADVLDVRADTATYLDRAAYLQGWDASATDVTVEIVRVRA